MWRSSASTTSPHLCVHCAAVWSSPLTRADAPSVTRGWDIATHPSDPCQAMHPAAGIRIRGARFLLNALAVRPKYLDDMERAIQDDELMVTRRRAHSRISDPPRRSSAHQHDRP